MKRRLILFAVLLAPRLAEANLDQIRLPPGFAISIYADNVPNARSMAFSPSGILYVGTRTDHKVYAVIDDNRDYRADRVITIAAGLRSPNGVAWKDGSLYVAEISRILRFDNIDEQLDNPPEPVVVYDQLPKEGHHGWKYIAFGPDGKLYIPIGAPCNVCLESDRRFSSILRMPAAGGEEPELFAEGIRNTVGFSWHPETEELWFTDNGRDMLGDNIPPDELNRAPRPGMHFGFPFCHGDDIADPEFGAERTCDEFTKPVQLLGPHVAALGMKFYTGTMFPEDYRNQVFIAEHGSWNRSNKIGYRLMLVELEGNMAKSYRVFAEGWLQGDDVWGRPVDILILPDGSMLVSDDYGNRIYRITYQDPDGR